MRSYLVACFVAVAITAIAIQGDAQTSPPPPSPGPATGPPPGQGSVPSPGPSLVQSTSPPQLRLKKPVLPHPHGCDCVGKCKKLRHSQVPYKPSDIHNYLSYENYPILCRSASSNYFGKPQKKYVCKQTFDCCRWCNAFFYKCLKVNNFGYCIRSAYKCMCRCIDNSSIKELPRYKPVGK